MSLVRVMVFASLTCSIVSDLQAIAGEPQRYTFTSGDHIITVDVHFSDPYVGRRLSFRNEREPSKEICLVGDGETGACIDHFVGAVATVTFTFAGAAQYSICPKSSRAFPVFNASSRLGCP